MTQTLKTLSLTKDQFDVLYDLLTDTIEDINENIDHEDITLSDYQLYHVWQQMDNHRDVDNVDQCIIDGNDYKDCVDYMVSKM